MRRTRRRPVASGRVSPWEALWFGVVLNGVAFVLLATLANPLTAVLTLSATLFYLFAIIFFWTPPHFWALALMVKDDYARAGVPMMPVVVSVEETKRQVLLYTIVLVALTLMFFTTRAVGWFYFASAAGLGLVYVYYTWRLVALPGISGAKSAYLFSLLYLALLFVVIVADVYVGI